MGLGIALILLATFAVFPSAARTDIQHIGVGDTIFVYEQNIDITGLRTGANPVTALRKYQEDNPAKELLREVGVLDDTSFSPIPEIFGGLYGLYFAFNPTDGNMHSVRVTVPSVSIDAVLASPNHTDSIQGLTLHDTGTHIAFKIISSDVGAYYHAGALYPATIDIVLTTPGGAQLTTIQGKDLSRMNMSAQVFYTDDPGRPGAISFENLEEGTYTVQAKWHDPASFDMQASDSNILSFSIGGKTITVTTGQPTPITVTPTRTATTPVPVTTTTTTPVPSLPPSTPPVTQPVTTLPAGTTPPSPAAIPTGTWPGVLSPALALIPLIRRRAPK
ncbi:MAG: DUF3821 domain-containing protein [Methanomicrobiales archaeon]|nr:DUF3821 domain-containing protein [Methanomicrobiales archaeon]